MTEVTQTEPQKFAFRKTGKVHRGLRFADGWVVCVCRCPGSQNGRLLKGAVKVADGWNSANCGN